MKILIILIIGLSPVTLSQQAITFPLDIGNKWFYQAGSTRDGYYYGVTKEIIDTLGNGSRQVLAKYYYENTVTTEYESWSFTDGKFYLNNTVLFNSNLTYDSCVVPAPWGPCWNLIDYNIFNISSDMAQSYFTGYSGPGGFASNIIITFPTIGIVKIRNYSYQFSFGPKTDSMYLIGLQSGNELLGDTIFVVTTIGEIIISPEEYNLSQNYPNPFNPITKINFKIPEAGFVSLKVYDLLGREIATIVNEEKSSGSYDIEFDGSNLISGIYFYKLQTENYSSVKKMILLK